MIRPLITWPYHEVLGRFMQYSDNFSIKWVKATQYLDEEFFQQQFSGYRVGHFTSFWLLGFSDHFHKSKLLVTTRQDTSNSLPQFSLWQHSASKTVVSGTKLPGLPGLCSNITSSDICLPKPTSLPPLGPVANRQWTDVDRHARRTDMGLLDEGTCLSSQGFFYLPQQTILFCTTMRLACF